MGKRILIAVLVFFSTLNNVIAEQTVQEAEQKRDTLRVGHILFPPFYFSQSVGMDADMIRSVAVNAQIKKVKLIQFKDLTSLLSALNEGAIDLIANGIIETADRAEQYLLTIPYDTKETGIGFLYKKKTVFQNTDDLKKLKIGTLKGSHIPIWLEKKNINPVKLELYENWDQLMDAFEQNKLDGVLTNYTACHYAQKKHQDSWNTKLIEGHPLVYMLRKQDKELQAKLNTSIDILYKNNSLQHIRAKYLK